MCFCKIDFFWLFFAKFIAHTFCTCSSDHSLSSITLPSSLSLLLVVLKDYRWSNGTSSSLPAVQFTASQCTGGTASSITDCASFESITYCPEHQCSAVLCSSKTPILYNIYLCIFYILIIVLLCQILKSVKYIMDGTFV